MSQYIWLRWSRAVFIVLILNLSSLSLHAQEDNVPPVSTTSPSPTNASKQVETGLFFDDVLVRGQPVFQVGSVGGLSATERAKIINRRITGLLNQSKPPDTVTVKFDPQLQVALLQVNNRVLMTVTQQDALDFDVTVE